MTKESLETTAAPVAATTECGHMTASVRISIGESLKALALAAGLTLSGYVVIKATNKLTRVRDKKVEISDK